MSKKNTAAKENKTAKAKAPKVNAKRKGIKSTASKNRTSSTRKGQLGEIFGFSVTSVLRKLGLEGVSCPHARAIMKAKGVKIGDKSCDTQVSFGRCKTRTPAALSKEQVLELKSCAPDPEAEEKAVAA